MSDATKNAKPGKKATAPKETPPPTSEPSVDKQGKQIFVHHLTRVEGHGNIVVSIDHDDKIETCRWEVPEAPRFFEAMVLGRSWRDIHHITSRICGICSIGHQLASLQATEEALAIRPSEQTHVLRKLALHGENMQSHLLHLGYLVLPDLLDVDSVIPLAQSHPDELKNLIALHRLANEFSRVISGRTTHPQRLIPGGMGKLPTVDELKNIRKQLEEAVPRLKAAAELFAALRDKMPDFERPTEYVALVSEAEYPLYWGEIGSSHDKRKPARFYMDTAKEYMVPHSTAKWARNVKPSYMVGALARFNLNHAMLHPLAKQVADQVGLKPMSTNPFYNNLAQLVEVVHSVEDSIQHIDKLLDKGLKREPYPKVEPRAGKGVGAVEVPRGLLFHAYEYDDEGRVVHADCVIPTNQNHANIQHDLDELTPTISGKSEAEIELTLSMLVRAYDPCISCSTHLIDMSGQEGDRGVRFVRASEDGESCKK